MVAVDFHIAAALGVVAAACRSLAVRTVVLEGVVGRRVAAASPHTLAPEQRELAQAFHPWRAEVAVVVADPTPFHTDFRTHRNYLADCLIQPMLQVERDSS